MTPLPSTSPPAPPPERTESPGLTTWHRVALAALAVGQVAALLYMWPTYARDINPDGVSYLRLAGYVATGQWDLAISGYWSPLIGWLIAPAIALGASPLAAVKVMLASVAVAYPLVTAFVLRRAGLGGWWVVAGATFAAALGVSDAYDINPDLLSALPLGLALGLMLSPAWVERRGVAVGSGAWLGVAYLAKAVMLPVSVALLPVWAALWAWPGGASRRAFRSAGWAAVGLALVAGPWIVVLSVDHGAPTFSITGPIAHGLMGPPDLRPDAPFPKGMRTRHVMSREYHVPPPGRISGVEDSRDLPHNLWSPFESRENLRHQGRIIVENTGRMVNNLRGFDRFATGLWALLAVALALAVPRTRARIGRDRWWWPAVPALGLAAIYLPVFAGAERYLYPAVPMLLAVTFGAIRALDRRALSVALVGVVAVSYLPAPLHHIRKARAPGRVAAAQVGARLADRLAEDGLTGPIIVASSPTKKGIGNVVPAAAYLLGTPLYGNEDDPDPARVVGSGARLVVTTRGHPLADTLARLPGARRIDAAEYALGDQVADLPRRFHTELIVLPPRDVSPAEAQRVFDRGR